MPLRQPSTFLWEDGSGHPEHSTREGMPMLFALGQHGALEATQARLGVGENVFAYLDDIHTVSGHAWMEHMLSSRRSFGPMYASTRITLRRKCGKRSSGGDGMEQGHAPLLYHLGFSTKNFLDCEISDCADIMKIREFQQTRPARNSSGLHSMPCGEADRQTSVEGERILQRHSLILDSQETKIH